MTPDSREARIEAEAVTDADEDSAWRKYADSIGCDYTAPTVHDDFRAGWNAAEAARKARASNDSGGSELCYGGGLALPHRIFRDPRAAPQPAPDRVSRNLRTESFAPTGDFERRLHVLEGVFDTLFAGVGHGVEAWNSALIAAAKAWNREGE